MGRLIIVYDSTFCHALHVFAERSQLDKCVRLVKLAVSVRYRVIQSISKSNIWLMEQETCISLQDPSTFPRRAIAEVQSTRKQAQRAMELKDFISVIWQRVAIRRAKVENELNRQYLSIVSQVLLAHVLRQDSQTTHEWEGCGNLVSAHTTADEILSN